MPKFISCQCHWPSNRPAGRSVIWYCSRTCATARRRRAGPDKFHRATSYGSQRYLPSELSDEPLNNKIFYALRPRSYDPCWVHHTPKDHTRRLARRRQLRLPSDHRPWRIEISIHW